MLFQIVALILNFIVAALVSIATVILIYKLRKLGRASVPRIALAKHTPAFLFLIFVVNAIFTIAIFIAIFIAMKIMLISHTSTNFSIIVMIQTIPMSTALFLSITIFSFLIYVIYILSKSSKLS